MSIQVSSTVSVKVTIQQLRNIATELSLKWFDHQGNEATPKHTFSGDNVKVELILDKDNTPKTLPQSLFCYGEFTLHSGAKSNFKIECDALSEVDWYSVANMMLPYLPPFNRVIGIPQGGLKLAYHLGKYLVDVPDARTLIVDDVLTTGRSMEEMKHTLGDTELVTGAVLFARGKCPSWIKPLFTMNQEVRNDNRGRE